MGSMVIYNRAHYQHYDSVINPSEYNENKVVFSVFLIKMPGEVCAPPGIMDCLVFLRQQDREALILREAEPERDRS